MRGERGRNEIYSLATLLYPRSGVAESFRSVRTNVEFASVDVPVRTLLVTSAVPGDGKSVLSANLAVVFAQAGRPVLLVDADLRKPSLHRIFDLPNTNGLTGLLRNDALSIDAVAQQTNRPICGDTRPAALPWNPAERSIPPDAGCAVPPPGERRPRHLRQPAPSGGHRCRRAEHAHRRHAAGHRLQADPSPGCASGPRDARASRGPRPRCGPQSC